MGTVVSSTPMPGTMTPSWRRTHEAMRKVSMTVPMPSPKARRPGRQHRSLAADRRLYQRKGAAGMPYALRHYLRPRAQHVQRSRRDALLCRYVRTASSEAVIPKVALSQQAKQADPGPRDLMKRGHADSTLLTWHVALPSYPAQPQLSGRRPCGCGPPREAAPQRDQVPGHDLTGGPVQDPLGQVAVALPPVGLRQRRTLDRSDVTPEVLGYQAHGRVP